MVTNRHGDPVDITLRSYETAAQRYVDQSAAPSLALCAFLDHFADTVGFGRVRTGDRQRSRHGRGVPRKARA